VLAPPEKAAVVNPAPLAVVVRPVKAETLDDIAPDVKVLAATCLPATDIAELTKVLAD